MTKIVPNLLNDTLNLVALARETALARGDQARAEKLAPVVDDLRSLVSGVPKTTPASAPQRAPSTAPSGVLAQDDFQTLLRAVQASGNTPQAAALSSATASQERNQVAVAMAAGGMPDVDIARQLGITREEVRLILSLNHPQKTGQAAPSGPAVQPLDDHKSSDDRPAGQVQGVRTAGRQIAQAYTRWLGKDEEVLE